MQQVGKNSGDGSLRIALAARCGAALNDAGRGSGYLEEDSGAQTVSLNGSGAECGLYVIVSSKVALIVSRSSLPAALRGSAAAKRTSLGTL
jgi:hypothetical protein